MKRISAHYFVAFVVFRLCYIFYFLTAFFNYFFYLAYTTVLDQFRVRHALQIPHCDMEPVQCEPHQDTCVTITMQVTHHKFWIGSGCDQRVNYDFPSGGRDGCVEMPAVYRNFHPGFMEERRTLQRVCLCSGNLCNSARPRHRLCCFLLLSALLPIASLLITAQIRLMRI